MEILCQSTYRNIPGKSKTSLFMMTSWCRLKCFPHYRHLVRESADGSPYRGALMRTFVVRWNRLMNKKSVYRYFEAPKGSCVATIMASSEMTVSYLPPLLHQAGIKTPGVTPHSKPHCGFQWGMTPWGLDRSWYSGNPSFCSTCRNSFEPEFWKMGSISANIILTWCELNRFEYFCLCTSHDG